MITTYVIEAETHFGYDVLNYTTTLDAAKKIALNHKEHKPFILQLKGPSFGEGFHQYRLQMNDNGDFICVDVMNLSKKKLNHKY